MAKYTATDVRNAPALTLEQLKKVMFAGREPVEAELVGGTFISALASGCNQISYSNVEGVHILSSCVSFLDGKALDRMLEGHVLGDPNTGQNSTRIETAFRYYFDNVAIWEGRQLRKYKGNFPDRALDYCKTDSISFALLVSGYGARDIRE